MPDNNGVQYTNPPQSRNEELLEDIITGTPYTAPPQSEIEEILVSIIDETPYNKAPQSRNADLLLQVKAIIETGGGGTYTIKGLEDYTIKPTNPADVTDSYKGTSYDDKTLANCPSLTTLLSTFYDKYVNANLVNYEVTKQSLGKDQSNTYDLYEYDFKPAKWDRMILLTSGMHGYEVSAIFGLAYLMNDIVENYADDELLTYLHEHVRIKVIPVINPWGYSQSPKSYVQSRGVNINRNFDYNGEWETYDPGSNPNNNKGTAPFSEAETQILRQWASDNYGAEFWIDCHTSVGVEEDKEIYTSSLTTSPFYSKVQSAHSELEEWTETYYSLQSVATKYQYDSPGAIKQRWYEGTYTLPMLVIEQCSKCTSIGITYNGDKNSIVNYSAQIYAYLGEFLLRADEVVNSRLYIEELQQTAIEDKKYNGSEPVEPTPEPTVLYVHQGTIKSADGTPDTTSTTRVYTEELPVSHREYHVIGFGDGYWFGGRYYDGNSGYTSVLSDVVANNTVHFKNSDEHEEGHSWGIASDCTIEVGSSIDLEDGAKMRLVIRTSADSTIEPDDVDGMEISVDGVTYVLRATTEATPLPVYQGTLDSSTGEPKPSDTRLYTAEIPVSESEYHVIGFGNGYWFGGRFYDGSGNFTQGLVDSVLSANVYFKNADEHSGSWGIADDVTIHVGSSVTLANVSKLRLIIRTEGGSDNLTPSDVVGKEITVDGITYVLTAGT